MNTNTLLRLLPWALLAAVAFATLSPIEMRPVATADPDYERMAAYAVLGGIFLLAAPRHPARLVLAIVVVAGLLEWLQNFVPGRHGELHDFGVKSAATLAGVMVAMLVRRGISARQSARAA